MPCGVKQIGDLITARRSSPLGFLDQRVGLASRYLCEIRRREHLAERRFVTQSAEMPKDRPLGL
jgi:hypothetical protein